MKSYAICQLGCKVNSYEAQSVEETFKSRGYISKDFKDIADIYVIFTCAVTNMAASKSRKKIHQAIKQNPNAIICVVGCYVQVDAKNLSEDDNIDILIGTKHKDKIVDIIEHYQNKQINAVESLKDVEFDNLDVRDFDSHTRAYLKIQDGCNQYCTYCIIPYARGKERSMNPDMVIEKARALALKHREIVLTGIHTGRYGKEYGVTLAQLIKRIINEVEGIERIRISSIEITEIDDELISLMKQDKRIARHLHIPLQSGEDGILKAMNRPYTCEEFLDRINYIRICLDNEVNISTDLIVGFAQESEESFNKTLEFLKQCELGFIHVFPFALKKGTKAEMIKNTITNDVKKQRVNEVLSLSNSLNNIYNANHLNKEVDILIEGFDGKYSYGYSSEYIYTYIEGEYPINSLVKAKITHLANNNVYAKGV